MKNICEWRKTFIFPDYYSVSENGAVRSERNGKILKPATDKYGYHYYVLCVEGKRHTIKAHRLVAMAFIPNPENKPTVNHKNGIRTDNRVVNLEWMTNKEQSNDPLTRQHLLADSITRDYKAMGGIEKFWAHSCQSMGCVRRRAYLYGRIFITKSGIRFYRGIAW